ncbi:MAG: DUF4082 domain-containing protein [Desulfobacteraceae bacterium]|nr:DUF4082 domain-containing protein [Desulfobacteraceae bacterium]
MKQSKTAYFLIVLFVTTFIGSAYASVFTPGNVLVSSGNVLYEYTPAGSLVQQVAIPDYGASRDLTGVGNGGVAVFNGTFSPQLSRYDVEAGEWSDMTAQGWSTSNNVTYGGIAYYGNAVFVTDMNTSNGGEANGIIRFDSENGTTDRYFSGTDYIDLALGLDNKFYALRNRYGDLDVIDPETMELVDSLDLGHSSGIRGVAVNGNGDIFAASWDGNIYHYDSTAQLVNSFSTGMGNLYDIDINESGSLIIGSRLGKIAITDEEFSFINVIDVQGASGGTFVAYAPTTYNKFIPGNILVSTDNVLHEYTPAGYHVRQVVIPEASGGISRDIIAADNSNVAVFNGTFSPMLSLYDVENEQWSDMTSQGWSTVNNGSFGGITYYGGAVFVTDMNTANGGEANGIIRFDSENGTTDRYFSGTDYIDLALGLDNKFYALRNLYGDLDVIDPETMELVSSLELGHTSGIRGVAVNSNGDIFAAGWDGNIYHYDSTVQVVDSFDTGITNLNDIDINESGFLVVGSRFGETAVTDKAFSFISVIDVQGSSNDTFAAFVPKSLPVPDPSASVTPWKDNESGNLGTGGLWDYAMGYHFTPLADGVVSKLGGFFDGTKTVRLFNKDTGELLAETTVTSSDDWQYSDISPVSVQEGTTYTVAAYMNGSGASYRYGIEDFPQEYGNIRIDGSTYVHTESDQDARPQITVTDMMFGQADIMFTAF